MKEILRHPLAIVATFSLLIVAGITAWLSLPVELLPSLKYPRLVIITSFGNAASEEVESLLTRPVEEAVGTVTGLRSMTSVSTEGISSVVLRFAWGSNMSIAAAEVREKLDLISDEFPREAKLPIVVQYDPTDTPIMTFAVTGSQDLTALHMLSKNILKPGLETVSGVATVRISGGLPPEIQVLVDRGRLVAHSVDLKLVTDRLQAANVNFPGGSLIKGTMEFPVRTVGRFKTIEEIASVSLGPGKQGGTIQVKDVAEVTRGHADRTNFCRVNGRSAVLLGIIKEPSANTVELSRRLMAKFDDLRRRLPEGTALEVVDDEAPFIERGIADLRNDILWGSALAFIVLLVFLRNPGSSASVMLAIPISVISTFGLMSFFGVTLNIMSIGGMALGVGMLLDCSIVVLEAIHRKSLKTRDMLEAASLGVSEVGASVVSGTVTTLAVLVPILFMAGMAQRLFRDFAFTMAGSLLISLLVSIVLLPAIPVLTRSSQRTTLPYRREKSSMESGYRLAVGYTLDHPAMLLGAWTVLVLASVLVIYKAGFELLPKVDVGRFTMNVSLPSDSSLESVENAVNKIEEWIRGLPGVESYVTEAGAERNKAGIEPSQEIGKPNEARISLKLDGDSALSNRPDKVIEALRERSESLKDAKIDFVLNQGPLARILGTKSSPELLLISGDGLEELKRSAEMVNQTLEKEKWIKDLYCDGNVWTENLQVVVDRYKAAGEGVSVDQVAQAVRAAIEGNLVGKFIAGDEEQDIRVRLNTKERTKPDDLKHLPVRAKQDRISLVGRIAEVTTGTGPREIMRTDKQRNIVFHGNVEPVSGRRDADDALGIAKAAHLPVGCEVKPATSRFELMESIGSLSVAIALAAMLVYVVLVVQFESLVWPFVVFTAVPVSLVGPAIILSLNGAKVNVLVLMGGLVLMGMVVNMAILMVATINALRGRGADLTSAIIDGSAIRLRPILMTTATTVFGALPICVAGGAADQLNKPLAVTIVAGLLASAMFKLFGLPAVYQAVARSRWGRQPALSASPDKV